MTNPIDELIDKLNNHANALTLGTVTLSRSEAGSMLAKSASTLTSLQERNRKLEDALRDVEYLIGDSGGVYGLHMNGDPAPWDELRTGGRFEDWLINFDRALLGDGA